MDRGERIVNILISTQVLAAFAAALRRWYAADASWAACVAVALLGQLAAFCVFHDASHGALSTARWVNVLGAYGGAAVGSPHEWTLQHALGRRGHHILPLGTDGARERERDHSR